MLSFYENKDKSCPKERKSRFKHVIILRKFE